MPHSNADKRRVFLALRSVFVGDKAQFRKSKKINQLITKHSASFGPLFRDFGEAKINEIVKLLLEARIFESELKAKIAFPELFQTSIAREEQRAASQDEVARSEAGALEEIESVGDEEEAEEVEEVDGSGTEEVIAGRLGRTEIASLYPSFLPYKTQHLILNTAQHHLEECCFDFATSWLPSVLKEKKWDCPEAGELNEWMKILVKRHGKIPSNALHVDPGTSLRPLFMEICKIRHSAVHRLQTSAGGIDEMIQLASKLAKTLGDGSRANQLDRLHLEVEGRIRDMELNKNFLENRLDEQLREIAEQRAELDRREKEVIATMFKEDEENSQLVAAILEASVKKAFSADATNATDLGKDTNEDNTDSNEDEEDDYPRKTARAGGPHLDDAPGGSLLDDAPRDSKGAGHYGIIEPNGTLYTATGEYLDDVVFG